jgi:hypothetical protein
MLEQSVLWGFVLSADRARRSAFLESGGSLRRSTIGRPDGVDGSGAAASSRITHGCARSGFRVSRARVVSSVYGGALGMR